MRQAPWSSRHGTWGYRHWDVWMHYSQLYSNLFATYLQVSLQVMLTIIAWINEQISLQLCQRLTRELRRQASGLHCACKNLALDIDHLVMSVAKAIDAFPTKTIQLCHYLIPMNSFQVGWSISDLILPGCALRFGPRFPQCCPPCFNPCGMILMKMKISRTLFHLHILTVLAIGHFNGNIQIMHLLLYYKCF